MSQTLSNWAQCCGLLYVQVCSHSFSEPCLMCAHDFPQMINFFDMFLLIRKQNKACLVTKLSRIVFFSYCCSTHSTVYTFYFLLLCLHIPKPFHVIADIFSSLLILKTKSTRPSSLRKTIQMYTNVLKYCTKVKM